jgi:hypothetical protein
LLRLGLSSTAAAIVAVGCAESVVLLGTRPLVALVGPAVTAVSFGAVATYCWVKGDAAHRAIEPSAAMRRVRNALAVGLVAMLTLSLAIAPSSQGWRSGARTQFTMTLAVAAVAVVLAAVAIVYGRREQGAFLLGGGLAPAREGYSVAGQRRHALDAIRTLHGWVALTSTAVAAMLVTVSASPYVYPFVGLVLIPSMSTWAYSALRMSRLERRTFAEPSSDRPAGPFRVARLMAVGVLSMVPVGVFWSVWLGAGVPDSGGVGGAQAGQEAAIVLGVAVLVGLVAAIVYPFAAVTEALRTPMAKANEHWRPDAGSGPIITPLDLDFLRSRAEVRSRAAAHA